MALIFETLLLLSIAKWKTFCFSEKACTSLSLFILFLFHVNKLTTSVKEFILKKA